MSPSDETLMAYADGEADEATRKLVETAMRDDPEVAARVARHRALRAAVSGAFFVGHRRADSRAAVGRCGKGSSDAAGQCGQPGPRARCQDSGTCAELAALCACRQRIVGRRHRIRTVARPCVLADCRRERRLGGPWRNCREPCRLNWRRIILPGGVVAIGLTYRTKSGEYCRTFSLTREASAGVACREGEAWQVKVLAGAASGRECAVRVPRRRRKRLALDTRGGGRRHSRRRAGSSR